MPHESHQPLLCLNAGSSSLSAAFFDGGDEARWTAEIDLTAGTGPVIRAADGTCETLDGPDPADFPAVAKSLLGRAEGAVPVHRIVHGGGATTDAVWLDAPEMTRLGALSPLAPIHQPVNLSLVRALAEERPRRRQIGVFDTAFHRTMPPLARALPVPAEGPFAGLRRYGFHGLSHEWVAHVMARSDTAPDRIVSLHLSGGASACAIRGGVSVDTTMGATPLDGLMMGSRSGSLDPGLMLYALGQGMEVEALSELLWTGAGLKGLSGLSSDPRDITSAGGVEAEAAIALYCRRAAQAVARMAVSIGGIDALVFTGGAGVEQAGIRARIAGDLGWMGVVLDPEANDRHAPVVSPADSAVELRLVPPEEERVMARHARYLIAREEA
ncbi:acetate/propionate family kinase [Wenxinia saemankumensis]|uniref:Acetate kinase n=1 Tax=Wenxinia saemankumensis TaxID=1447782 RepID=A0A1M6HTR1_9RHOB|nr:hypothetical protein [Wenxinia saemankumensis]SHJ25581.1 acetate kinase [Wenxinia saemankumensis]